MNINSETGSGIFSSNLGKVYIQTSLNKLCVMYFVQDGTVVSPGTAAPNESIVMEVLDVLNGKKERANVDLLQGGTIFQKEVFEAISKIEFGKTATYADIAKTIGRPKAVRAVGSACGANNIAVIIPCHRVIKTNGEIGKYRWGVEKKELILKQEQLIFAGKSIS